MAKKTSLQDALQLPDLLRVGKFVSLQAHRALFVWRRMLVSKSFFLKKREEKLRVL